MSLSDTEQSSFQAKNQEEKSLLMSKLEKKLKTGRMPKADKVKKPKKPKKTEAQESVSEPIEIENQQEPSRQKNSENQEREEGGSNQVPDLQNILNNNQLMAMMLSSFGSRADLGLGNVQGLDRNQIESRFRNLIALQLQFRYFFPDIYSLFLRNTQSPSSNFPFFAPSYCSFDSRPGSQQ